MNDPTVARRDPGTTYWAYEQWLAAQKRGRATKPGRPWKVTVSRNRARTVYVQANPY